MNKMDENAVYFDADFSSTVDTVNVCGLHYELWIRFLCICVAWVCSGNIMLCAILESFGLITTVTMTTDMAHGVLSSPYNNKDNILSL